MSEIEIQFYENPADENAVNEKCKNVLIIFGGIGGTTDGREQRYKKIAQEVISRYPFSVAVATNPRGSWLTLKDNFYYVMNYVFNKVPAPDPTIYVLGSSVGANLALSFSHLIPQIKRVLAVNPVINMNLHLTNDGIKSFNGERVTVVLGEHDPSLQWLPMLIKSPRLQTAVISGADHGFTCSTTDFINLPFRYLFGENDR